MTTTPSLPAGIDRRALLRGAAASLGAGLWLSGCESRPKTPSAGGRPFEGQSLRVFVYSGAWEKAFEEAFAPSFEAATGATAIAVPGWWDSIANLKASPKGQPCYDLVLTDATQGVPAIREGLFGELDLAKLPHLAGLAPSVLKSPVYEQRRAIPFPESVMTLGYNRERLGFEPQGWEDLLKDELAGKLGIYNSFYMSLHTFAAMKAGLEGKAGQAHELIASDLDGVFDFAIAHRDRVKLWWKTSTDMAIDLRRKTCAAGNMHSPDMLLHLEQSPELGAVVPAADRAFVQLMWVIPADTPKPALAHAALNHLLSPEVQRGFAEVGSCTANLEVAAQMAKDKPRWGQVYPSTAADLAALEYYPYEAYFRDWDAIVQRWEGEVLRKAS